MNPTELAKLKHVLKQSKEPLPGFWNLLSNAEIPPNVSLRWCKQSAYAFALSHSLGAMLEADGFADRGDVFRDALSKIAPLAFGASLMCGQHNKHGSADQASEWRSKCERLTEMLNGLMEESIHGVVADVKRVELADRIYKASGEVTTERVRRMWADMGGTVAAWETN